MIPLLMCKEGGILSETYDKLAATLVGLTVCRGSSGTLVDEDPSGSAAPAEAASANKEDSSGLAADAQVEEKEEGKEKGKEKGKKRKGKAKGEEVHVDEPQDGTGNAEGKRRGKGKQAGKVQGKRKGNRTRTGKGVGGEGEGGTEGEGETEGEGAGGDDVRADDFAPSLATPPEGPERQRQPEREGEWNGKEEGHRGSRRSGSNTAEFFSAARNG